MGLLIGFLGGVFGGLVGLGGGTVMIPLMVGLLKLPQHRAHGTSLVAVFFTGLVGALTYGLQGSLDPKAALFLALTAILTARFGARFAHGLSERNLKRSFGWFLIAVSFLLLLRPYLAPLGLVRGELPQDLALLLAGAFTGFLSGMMGVGGGTIMVPAMVLLLGMPQHTAQGTSLLAMVPASLVGAHTHLRLGNVDQDLALGLVPGVLVGTFLGGARPRPPGRRLAARLRRRARLDGVAVRPSGKVTSNTFSRAQTAPRGKWVKAYAEVAGLGQPGLGPLARPLPLDPGVQRHVQRHLERGHPRAPGGPPRPERGPREAQDGLTPRPGSPPEALLGRGSPCRDGAGGVR